MKLKRLVLQGFKSFKDRTVIHFDNGITGIVGPNGCGKSNIVDALFWVMGEQSAKHLRGKTMKDVIFSGSQKYAPASWSEVSLVLENTHSKHIHIGGKVCQPNEIQLTRKLYRNGDTEYRINSLPARLKDIQEVFMDTGAGAKSYSIIAQGEIDRLVKAKPEERRAMIEEVAGITKFKMRKRESMRKIENTQANLSRLQDLQAEIEKNLKALQYQSEKANKAKQLKEKIQRYDLSVSAHKEFELLKEIRDTQNLLNEVRIQVDTWTTQKSTIEVDLESERLEKDELTEELDNKQSAYNQSSRELAAAEERLTYLKKSFDEKKNILESKQRESEEHSKDQQEWSGKLEQLKARRSEMASQMGVEVDLSGLGERVEELKEDFDSKEKHYKELATKIQERRSLRLELESTAFKEKSRLEEYSRILQDVTMELEELEKKTASSSNEVTQNRNKLNSEEKLRDEVALDLEGLKVELQEANEQRQAIDERLKLTQKDLIQKESRRDSLIEVNRRMEGSPQGNRQVIEQWEGEDVFALGEMLKCDEEYLKPVNRLLGDDLDFLKGTDKLVDFAQENSDLGFQFFWTTESVEKESQELIERLKLQGCGEVLPLKDVVTFRDENLSDDLEKLLWGSFIVENLTPKIVAGLPEDLRFRSIVARDAKTIVSHDGNCRKLKVSSDEHLEGGVIARNKEIERLNAELEELEQRIPELVKELESLEEKRSEINEQLEEKKEAHASAKANCTALSSLVETLEKNQLSGDKRYKLLKEKKQDVSQSRLKLLEDEDTTRKQLEATALDIEVMERQESELKGKLEKAKEDYQLQNEELVQKQIELKSYTSNIKAIEEQINGMEDQIERIKLRIKQNAEEQDLAQTDIQTLERDSAELTEANQAQAKYLAESEVRLNEFKDKLAELLSGMQDREDQVKALAKKIAKAEKDVVHKELKFDQYLIEEEQNSRNIFEKYRIDLRHSIREYLELDEDFASSLKDIEDVFFIETESGRDRIAGHAYSFNRKYGQELKEMSHKLRACKAELTKLGDINWQAIEDYERQKLRFDFLKEQEAVLKDSLSDLEEAIVQIEEKSKTRFKEAFYEVNKRFEQVFPIIFGGGSASLKQIGELDSEELGVDIIAQPPGKKMQNINLMSGGEKALTAVSLIFSIFLVKPSPFCLLDEVDAPLDDANVGRFNELLREMSEESQFILITHNKKTMEMNDVLYGVTMQDPGISKAVSVQLQ